MWLYACTEQRTGANMSFYMFLLSNKADLTSLHKKKTHKQIKNYTCSCTVQLILGDNLVADDAIMLKLDYIMHVIQISHLELL